MAVPSLNYPRSAISILKILSVGPDDHAKFYYGLASIAIDYVKIMQQEKKEIVASLKYPRIPPTSR